MTFNLNIKHGNQKSWNLFAQTRKITKLKIRSSVILCNLYLLWAMCASYIYFLRHSEGQKDARFNFVTHTTAFHRHLLNYYWWRVKYTPERRGNLGGVWLCVINLTGLSLTGWVKLKSGLERNQPQPHLLLHTIMSVILWPVMALLYLVTQKSKNNPPSNIC